MFKMFGVSQKYIAEQTGRHLSTIQRRLDNQYRRDRNIDPIPKTRLVQRVPESEQAAIRLALKSGEQILGLEQYFVCCGVVYRSDCCIYGREFDILSGKAAKYFYRRQVQDVLYRN